MREQVTSGEILRRAAANGTAVPGFNIPYLPMMAPVVEALRETETVGLVMVARLEITKFEARSAAAVRDEYERLKDERFTRLHMDHVPVIDEDDERVDAYAELAGAVELGYGSVMIDGSRLGLEENIAETRRVAEMARARGVAVEAELGAVLGHEAGPMPPYEELYASRRGFTDPEEAGRFVRETGVDWLSVAVGSVHGAVSKARKDHQKIAARLDIAHLDRIRERVGAPLVLHGGTGIPGECVREAIRHGIAKINVATAIRQAYERELAGGEAAARDAVRRAVVRVVTEDLELAGSARELNPEAL